MGKQGGKFMSYVHIITVGASLASNYEKEKVGKRIPEARIEEKLSKMSEAEKSQYIKRLLKYIQKKNEENKLTETSAELNAVSEYFSEISIAYLIHTDTNLGKCCANALKQYLEQNDIQVAEPIEIKGLHGPETFQKGLARLVHQIANILANHRNVRICATGGFKPETAIATLLGFMAKAPVYYIHESFHQHIHLPAIPIDWKYPLKKYQKAIDAILTAGEKGIDKRQFKQQFGTKTYQALKQHWLIEERGNQCIATDISRAILKAIVLLTRARNLAA
jgi:putative CRISPR-associated protein (TIGR02619 family)